MVALRVLSRTSPAIRSIQPLCNQPFPLSSCLTWRLHPPYYQCVPHTSRRHGGVPSSAPKSSLCSPCLCGKSITLGCTDAQNSPFVSPLFATLTHSLSRKSFPCHSYANTRDRGVTPPPKFLSPLATRHSPRHSDRSSISFRINTCKSVSKQTALTPFRINTYEKHREGEGFGPAPVYGSQLTCGNHGMRWRWWRQRPSASDYSEDRKSVV